MFRPMMVAAVAALQNTEEWHAQMNQVYAKRRVIAHQIMDTLGCTYDKSQVGMFIWAKIPDHYSDSGVLADEILYGKNVFITPGFIFGDKGKRYVRISLCCPEPTLLEALERIRLIG
jgi:aspartate/methionine/tyrosine aminotransferase